MGSAMIVRGLPIAALVLFCGHVAASPGFLRGDVGKDESHHSMIDGPVRDACRKWSLTPAQVKQFFALSKRYSGNPYSEFYQVPCSISGVIEAEGREWKYEIKGGGTATWIGDGEVRYWGCAAKECEPLVILLTDSMSGD